MKSILKFGLIPLLLPALIGQAAITVTNIAPGCMAEHSLFLKSDGSLWAMGDNQYGELGDGTTSNSIVPEQIVASNVTAIAAGGFYSLLVKSDGSMWAMGWENLGELGNGNDSFYVITNRPEEIVSNGVTTIAAGGYHSLFLKSDSSLWAMGSDDYGQLGDGSTGTDATRPKQIVPGGVTAIAAGGFHSMFIKSDGSLWVMGWNAYGELGDGTTNYTTSVPEEIVASNVTAIAAGEYHSLFVESDGSLWAMGWNSFGELGDGATETSNAQTNRPALVLASGVTAVGAGEDYSLFLKSDGSIWGMGNNYNGVLGNGTIETDPNVPEPGPTNGVTAIAAGGDHSLYLKSDGSLWGMGNSEYGQLGDGFTDNIYFPGIGTPEQIYPPPQPVMDSPVPSQINLQINATCGFGGNYRLLSSSNVALALSQWTPLSTNAVTVRGPDNFSVTLTNAVNLYRQQFYILQSQ
jgi:alpha-tubulin suppressor-like RCC1 family protein